MRPSARAVWSFRRWLYAVYLLVAIARIPARTRFHLQPPRCDWRLTMENASLSMTKVPHMVLFGAFFVITLLQFSRVDRRSLAWSVVATAALGFYVELAEGATRTGNCRMTDVLPDIFGALIATVIVMAVVIVVNERRARSRRSRS